MTPKLSIVIPVYNGQNYIVRCLDSVFALPLLEEELEVIVVDDCSTDNTLQIMRQYAEKHANMIVLHQDTNQRQGAARNRGIDLAIGEYISFVDADDWIVEEGYKNALNAVAKSHVDICYFEIEQEYKDGKYFILDMPPETHNTIMPMRDYLDKYYNCYTNGSTRNLFRASFLKATNIRFAEGIRWEDCDWTVKVYLQTDKVQFVDGIGYHYYRNEGSTSHQLTPQAMAERVMAGCRLLKLADECGINGLRTTLTDEARWHYIIGEVRLRNLTKHPFKEIVTMQQVVGKENWTGLSSYSWPKWEQFFIRCRKAALCVLFFACPLAATGRKIVNIIRNI